MDLGKYPEKQNVIFYFYNFERSEVGYSQVNTHWGTDMENRQSQG